MLIILQELMHRTFVETTGRAPKRSEIPKPCEYFDLIAGTGTGGLIALMLGRLRLDLETCKDMYVRMTKRVFETDKTIAGIPYRSTLFKASRLEEAIRDCVREHTVYENEGNDNPEAPDFPGSFPNSPRPLSGVYGPQRSVSNASRYSLIGASPTTARGSMASMRWGNPNALLYDTRENRTKTAVGAVYQGTKPGGGSVLLRSYDSRKESPIEPGITIWQAGRATAATGLAFKAIQVGQSKFLDEGAGQFNPAPQILDEAVVNEWPGRDVGVFISIGTGKRPAASQEPEHLWWEGFMGSNMDNFAEARRRLIAKIEGCEQTHQYMLREKLSERGVNPENYYRLNVEVGVGEFGMNEWNRLADISTNTRRYLSNGEVVSLMDKATGKLAKIHFAKQRWDRGLEGRPLSFEHQPDSPPPFSPENPLAVELPAEDVIAPLHPHHSAANQMLSPQSARRPSEDEKYVIATDDYTGSPNNHPTRTSLEAPSPYGHSPNSSFSVPYRLSSDGRPSGERPRPPPPAPPPAPPVPPKTPINQRPRPNVSATMNKPPAGVILPYPDHDGPPPTVNRARKPNLS